MRSNVLKLTTMQASSLSKIVWLQLIGIAIFPTAFNRININNDYANVLIFATGLLILSYLLLRNFAFNDAKYKTKLLFGILPLTPSTIIVARGIIVYVFCVIAAPLLVLFSHATHAIVPETFAIIQLHILPYGLLLTAICMPIEFLLFYIIETQKADIIGAFAMFPYMGLMALIYTYMMNGLLLVVVCIIAVAVNMLCYRLAAKAYRKMDQ